MASGWKCLCSVGLEQTKAVQKRDHADAKVAAEAKAEHTGWSRRRRGPEPDAGPKRCKYKTQTSSPPFLRFVRVLCPKLQKKKNVVYPHSIFFALKARVAAPNGHKKGGGGKDAERGRRHCSRRCADFQALRGVGQALKAAAC